MGWKFVCSRINNQLLVTLTHKESSQHNTSGPVSIGHLSIHGYWNECSVTGCPSWLATDYGRDAGIWKSLHIHLHDKLNYIHINYKLNTSSSSSSFISKTFVSSTLRRFSRYEASPHIPGANSAHPYHPSHILFQIFLPLPAHLTPATTTFLQADTQSSPLLRSTCPNHLIYHASPPQPRSEPQKTVQIHTALQSFSDTATSISPSSVPSSLDFADLLSSSPRFQSHMSIHSGHKPCISFPLCGMMHPELSG